MYSTALVPFESNGDFISKSTIDGALPSAFAAGAGNSRITLNSGTRQIFINGTHNNDIVVARKLDEQTIRISFTGVETKDFNIADVDSIRFKGRKGDDLFSNELSIESTIFGDEGNDSLYGGNADDVIHGGAGDDQIFGRAGNDNINGSGGDDFLRGANGNDFVRGGSGHDNVYGDNGDDTLIGDAGNDRLIGGNDNDVLHGWTGNDEMQGGTGNDSLYAYGGDDSLAGDAGNDLLDAGDGNDVLNGGSGDDVLRGGAGHDSLDGGPGNDNLKGNGGADELLGGTGVDELRGGEGNDVLLGGVRSNEFDTLRGDSGFDHLLYFSNHVLVGVQTTDLVLRFSNFNDAWTEKEILVINRGIQKLHDETDNALLVRDYLTNKRLNLVKYASLTGGATAENALHSSTVNGVTTHIRQIRFSEWNENSEPHNVAKVTAFVHEIAHNFDNANEQNAHPFMSTADFANFKALSGWRSTNPNSSAYARSGDGQWWYLKSAQFFRSYSTISPFEDWATIWELNFDDGAPTPPVGSNLWQKLTRLRNILARMK